MNLKLDTVKKRDTARWILFAIAFVLMIYDWNCIEQNYNLLYDFEIQEYQDNLQTPLYANTETTITPGRDLVLQRDTTFRIISICLNSMFMLFLYVGRIKKEDLKK